jgi:tetratricopeptide (TPR) repeat protein
VLWRGTRAVVLARMGDTGQAIALASRAVDLAADTDCLMLHADALRDRAQVWSSMGRSLDAAHDLDQAIALYERKGIGPSATAARKARQALAVTPIA